MDTRDSEERGRCQKEGSCTELEQDVRSWTCEEVERKLFVCVQLCIEVDLARWGGDHSGRGHCQQVGSLANPSQALRCLEMFLCFH